MAAPATLSALLESLNQSLSLTQEAVPALSAIDYPKEGISLLHVKNEVLLSYLEKLVFLILLKIRKHHKSKKLSGDDSLDEKVRSKLVELRLYLEKGARPLEEKLKFSIERFLRTADDAQRREKATSQRAKQNETAGSGSDDDDDDDDDESEHEQSQDLTRKIKGKMAAAPKFGNLVDDVTARPAQRDGAPSGVYRPPRRDRQVMDAGARREKAGGGRPAKSRTMEEFVNSELASAPMAEPSIGTTIVQGGRRMKTAADREVEAERREYEETNYTRLPKESKKDRAKRARQEGGSRSMQFGGEEWHDLGQGVDRIDRLTKRREGGRGGGVRALLEKSRKRGHETIDGPRGSGHAMGDKFNKRVKMLEADGKSRGKNR